MSADPPIPPWAGDDEGGELLRRAVELATGFTARELAARLGISTSLLYACLDPFRPHRLGNDRGRELAAILRAQAAELEDVAARLDALARQEARLAPPEPSEE